MLSNYLAEIWGISIVIVSLALLMKDKHLRSLLSSIETEENFFLLGVVNFVIGISMILAHNIWVQDWRVIVTILGWLALIRGLSLLFYPELIKNLVKKIKSPKIMPYALMIALIIGLTITYYGFTG